MKRGWRRVLTVAIAAILVGAIVYAFLPDPVGVDLAPVRRGDIVVTVDEDGRTRLKDRYEVSAPLAGRMLRIELKAGDEVVAGETVLARIEPVPPSLLDARAQAESEGRVRAAEAAVSRARPLLAQAEEQLDLARREFERMHEAGTRGGATPTEMDRAQVAVRQAEEERRAAAFSLEIAQYELSVAQAALTRTQEAEGQPTDRFEVRSPITGRVLRVLRESAGVVSPGEALLEVGDPSDLEVEVDVLSVDAVKIAEGARATIEHWGGPGALAARVRLIEPSAFTKVSALGVEEQRVNAILDFDGDAASRPGLGDGFRVEARIVVQEGRDVLLVPVSALFRSGREWAVFVERGGRASTRIVRLGMMNTEDAEVLEGLAAGERVVLYPSDRVAQGVRVRARAGAAAGEPQAAASGGGGESAPGVAPNTVGP